MFVSILLIYHFGFDPKNIVQNDEDFGFRKEGLFNFVHFEKHTRVRWTLVSTPDPHYPSNEHKMESTKIETAG